MTKLSKTSSAGKAIANLIISFLKLFNEKFKQLPVDTDNWLPRDLFPLVIAPDDTACQLYLFCCMPIMIVIHHEIPVRVVLMVFTE